MRLVGACTVLTMLALAGCGAGSPDEAAVVRSISGEVLGGLVIGMLEPEARAIGERFGHLLCTPFSGNRMICSVSRERGAWPGFVQLDFRDGALEEASVILDEAAFAHVTPATLVQRLAGYPREFHPFDDLHGVEWISSRMGAGVGLACTTLDAGGTCLVILSAWLPDDS